MQLFHKSVSYYIQMRYEDFRPEPRGCTVWEWIIKIMKAEGNQVEL